MEVENGLFVEELGLFTRHAIHITMVLSVHLGGHFGSPMVDRQRGRLVKDLRSSCKNGIRARTGWKIPNVQLSTSLQLW